MNVTNQARSAISATLLVALVSIASAVVACRDGSRDAAVESQIAGASEANAAAKRDKAMANAKRLATSSMKDVGGFIFLSDDQLANNHSAFAQFTDKHDPDQCSDEIPLEGGGRCAINRPCDPDAGDAPPTPGTPLDVGTLTIKTAFGTLALEREGDQYSSDTLPGPFWRGDGDAVAVSFPGEPGKIPSFAFEAPAPVGDVVGRMPTGSIPRTGTMHFDWSYGQGSNEAASEIVVIVFQSDMAVGCNVPLSKRSLDIPPAALGRFLEGPANVFMLSTYATTKNGVVEQGQVKVGVSMQGSVDVGEQTGEVELK